jgi:hypothetical protein
MCLDAQPSEAPRVPQPEPPARRLAFISTSCMYRYASARLNSVST